MKIIKYALIAATFLLVGYNSIEIKPLDQVKKAGQKFDSAAYARDYLTKIKQSGDNKAVEIRELVSMLELNKIKAFDQLSHAVSIGNIRHFLVKGEGVVTKINEDDIILAVSKATPVEKDKTVYIATEFIYGSSIRDATGLFDIKQFTNNADMNNISAEINKIIRTETVPPFKQKVKVGDTVQFIGALEMNQQHPIFDNFEILPIDLK
jgi:predicted lipoprotein